MQPSASDFLLEGIGATGRADRLIEQGHADEAAGNFIAAHQRYLAARKIAPNYPRAHINAGNVCRAMGLLDEALVHFLTVKRIAPEYPSAHYNLGALYVQRREVELAETSLRRALELDPGMTDALVMLADLQEAAGQVAQAEETLRKAATPPGPHNVGAITNLAQLLSAQFRVDEASELLAQAIACDPGFALAHAGQGSLGFKTRRHAEAVKAFDAALALQPDLDAALSGQLFLLNFRDDVNDANVFDAHRRAGLRLQSKNGGRQVNRPPRPADGTRRLRVGYVSGDFRQHPVGFFMLPVLKNHDRTRIEVFCYSNDEVVDDLGRALRACESQWRSIASLNDADAASLVASDGIDILVDLAGHTAATRLPMFSLRPAPVQVSWLGYLNTTGLPEIDFRLCDRHTDPVGLTDAFHTEKLVRLAHSQWCYAPFLDVPLTDPPHREEPDSLVFGSFNQFGKISDACLDLWCRVLTQLPHAKLNVFAVPLGSTRIELLAHLAKRGIDPGRVHLHGHLDIMGYFNAIGNVDIALDTMPYTGATTTLDILWMGVPLVALRGQRAIARGSYSILSSLGVSELIAQSEDEYVRANIKLAENPTRRRELRRMLRSRLEASPLMDAQGFVRDLERCFESMAKD